MSRNDCTIPAAQFLSKTLGQSLARVLRSYGFPHRLVAYRSRSLKSGWAYRLLVEEHWLAALVDGARNSDPKCTRAEVLDEQLEFLSNLLDGDFSALESLWCLGGSEALLEYARAHTHRTGLASLPYVLSMSSVLSE